MNGRVHVAYWAGGVAILLSVLLASPLPLSPSETQAHSKRGSAAIALDDPAVGWPVYLHDAARSGSQSHDPLLNASTAANLTLAWTYTTGGVVASEPIVVNHTVYIGAWDGYFIALNESTGALRWKTFVGTSVGGCSKTLHGVTSTATYDNGTLYVGGGDQYWYALNASSGAIEWTIATGNTSRFYHWGSGLVVSGHLYIPIASWCDKPLVRGRLLQVSLSTHMVTKTFFVEPAGRQGGGIWSSPTYDPSTNTIFVTTGNGPRVHKGYGQSIVALNATTLLVKSSWMLPSNVGILDDDWGTTPTLVDAPGGQHLVTAANKDGREYAFNRSNLSTGPLWSTALAIGGGSPESGAGSVSSASFDGAFVYAAGGKNTILGTPYNGSIRALDPSTGAAAWTVGRPGIILAAVTSSGGFVVDDAGSVLEIRNASTGLLLFSYATGSVLFGPATISGGCVFQGSTDFTIYAFSLPGTTCGVEE